MLKKLIIILAITLLPIIASAETLTASNECAVFTKVDDMLNVAQLLTIDHSAAIFVMNELMAAGKLTKIPENTPVEVIAKAPTGIYQLYHHGYIFYTFGPRAFK